MHVKLHNKEPFKCQVCGVYKMRSQSYIISPHPAILNLILEKDRIDKIGCNKCAKREAGSKGWKYIHE